MTRSGGSEASFYADDGLVEGTGAGDLQRDLDLVIGLFARFGLQANCAKTKFMVIRGPQVPLAQESTIYNRVQAGGLSH